MRKRFDRLGALGGLLLGSLPGFLIPVALIAFASPDTSDTFILILGINQLLVSVTAGTVEAQLVTAFAKIIAGSTPVSASTLRSLRISVATIPASVTAVVMPAMIWVSTLSSSHIAFSSALIGALPLLISPAVSGLATPWSALLLANSRLGIAFMGNFFRGSLTLFCAVFFPTVWTLTISYVAGELLRFVFLRFAARKLASARGDALEVKPSLASLAHQMTSMGLNQSVPIFVRACLASGAPGLVSLGELAMRVLVAANQVSSSTITVRAVVSLPGKFRDRGDRSTQTVLAGALRRLVFENLVLTTVVLLGVASAAVLATMFGLDEVADGLWLSLPLQVGVVLVSVEYWSSRALLLAGVTWFLPVASAIGLAGTVAVTLTLSILVDPIWSLAGLIVGYLSGASLLTAALFRHGAPRLRADPELG